MKKFIELLFLLNLFYTAALAQSYSGTVLGKENKEPVGYATIALINKDSTYANATLATEDGNFIMKTNGCLDCSLKITAIGYKTSIFKLDSVRTVFFLEHEENLLGEVVVKASPRIVKMNQSGNLEIRVAGSHLSNRNNLKELLLSVPGIIQVDGNIKSISGATPLYVVNGRKVQSYAEVAALSVKNIKSIEVNNNPGIEYGGNVETVIFIKTEVPLAGPTLNTQASVTKNRTLSHDEYLNAAYGVNDILFYGTLQYANQNKKSFQDITYSAMENLAEPFYSHNNLKSHPSGIRKFNYDFGIDMRLSSHHILSCKMDGYFSNLCNTGNSTNEIIDSGNTVIFNSYSELNEKSDYKHVAINYSYTNEKGKSFSLTTDYATTHSHRVQETREEFSYANEVTNVENQVTNRLFSIIPHFTFPINKKLSTQFGGQIDAIKNNGNLNYERIIEKRNSESTELISAAYIGLTYYGRNYQTQIGIRYENNCNTFLQGSEKIEQNNNQILPYASLTFLLGKSSHQLSFKYDLQRPPLGFIGGYSYYLNRYKIQEGNPMLRAQRNTSLNYSLSWKNFYFTTKYQYVKSPIMALSTLENYSNNETVKSSWYNLEKQHNITIMMNYSNTFKWYKPSLTIAYIQHSNYIETEPKQMTTLNRPVPYVKLQNAFQFPWLDINVNYEFTGKGHFRVFLTEKRHILDLSVQKRWLHESLSVSLYWNDVLRQNISRYETCYQGLSFRQREDQDRQIFGLIISYRFNDKQKAQKIKSSNQIFRL